MNLVDALVSLLVVSGTAIGAQRGVIRQLGLVAGLYASYLIATQAQRALALLFLSTMPWAAPAVARTYVLIGATVIGTAGFVWLSNAAHQRADPRRLRTVDRVVGAGLGLVWTWAVAAFALTLIVQLLDAGWGTHSLLRRGLLDAVDHSWLAAVLLDAWPAIRDAATSTAP